MNPSARPLGSTSSPSMSGVRPPTIVRQGWGHRIGMFASCPTRSFLMASPDQILSRLDRSFPLPPLNWFIPSNRAVNSSRTLTRPRGLSARMIGRASIVMSSTSIRRGFGGGGGLDFFPSGPCVAASSFHRSTAWACSASRASSILRTAPATVLRAGVFPSEGGPMLAAYRLGPAKYPSLILRQTDRPMAPAATAKAGTPRKSAGQPMASAPSRTSLATGSGRTFRGKGSAGGRAPRRIGPKPLAASVSASGSGGGASGSIRFRASASSTLSGRAANMASQIGQRAAARASRRAVPSRSIGTSTAASRSAIGRRSSGSVASSPLTSWPQTSRASGWACWGWITGHPLRPNHGSSRASRAGPCRSSGRVWGTVRRIGAVPGCGERGRWRPRCRPDARSGARGAGSSAPLAGPLRASWLHRDY